LFQLKYPVRTGGYFGFPPVWLGIDSNHPYLLVLTDLPASLREAEELIRCSISSIFKFPASHRSLILTQLMIKLGRFNHKPMDDAVKKSMMLKLAPKGESGEAVLIPMTERMIATAHKIKGR
jgi:hypothetical protein